MTFDINPLSRSAPQCALLFFYKHQTILLVNGKALELNGLMANIGLLNFFVFTAC